MWKLIKSVILLLLIVTEGYGNVLSIDEIDSIITTAHSSEWPDNLNLYKEALSRSNNRKLYNKSAFCADLVARAFRAQQAYDSAIHYHELTILYDQLDDNSVVTKNYYNNQALTYYYKADYHRAIESYSNAAKYDSLTGDFQTLSNSLHGLAISYSMLSDYIESIRNYQLAIKLKNRLGDIQAVSHLNKNIGIVYSEFGLYELALAHLQEAIKTEQDSGVIRSTLNSIGVVHEKLRNYDEAAFNFKKALVYAQQTGHQRTQSDVLNNLGNLMEIKGEFDSALLFYLNALEIKKELNNPRLLASGYLNLADTYMLKQDNRNAGYYLAKLDSIREVSEIGRVATAIDLLKITMLVNGKQYSLANQRLLDIFEGKKIQENDLRLDFLQLQSEVKWKVKNYVDYQIYNSLYHQLKDSIFKSQRLAVVQLQNDYYLEQKENEKQILSQQNDLLTLNNQNQALRLNQQLIFLFAAISIIMLVGWFLINSRKKNKIISSQVEEIAQQNVTIQGFLKDNHHRITNHLQMISTMLSLQAQNEGDTSSQTLLDAKQRIDSANTIHRKLKKEDGYSTVPILAYLEAIVTENEAIAFLQEQAVTKDISSDVEQLPVDIATSLGIITNELVTNSFKYAFNEVKEAFIGLSLNRNKDYLFFNYRDNGPGNIKWKKSEQSFGHELIWMIAKNLGGEPEVNADSGFRFKLKFQMH